MLRNHQEEKQGSLEDQPARNFKHVQLPQWQETIHNPTTTRPHAGYRMDTLGKPNDAYALTLRL